MTPDEARQFRVSVMMDWLRENGGDVDGVDVAFTAHGRELVATRRVARGGVAAITPAACVLHTVMTSDPDGPLAQWQGLSKQLGVGHHPVIGKDAPGLNDVAMLALTILLERSKGPDDSFYAPFLGVLPTMEELRRDDAVPLALSVETLKSACAMSQHYCEKARELREITQAMHAAVVLLNERVPVFPPHAVPTLDDVMWAKTMVSSRGYHDMTMRPLTDMANHRVTSLSPEWVSGGVAIFAAADLEPGDRVYVSYGRHDSMVELLSYGFHEDHLGAAFYKRALGVDEYAELASREAFVDGTSAEDDDPLVRECERPPDADADDQDGDCVATDMMLVVSHVFDASAMASTGNNNIEGRMQVMHVLLQATDVAGEAFYTNKGASLTLMRAVRVMAASDAEFAAATAARSDGSLVPRRFDDWNTAFNDAHHWRSMVTAYTIAAARLKDTLAQQVAGDTLRIAVDPSATPLLRSLSRVLNEQAEVFKGTMEVVEGMWVTYLRQSAIAMVHDPELPVLQDSEWRRTMGHSPVVVPGPTKAQAQAQQAASRGATAAPAADGGGDDVHRGVVEEREPGAT